MAYKAEINGLKKTKFTEGNRQQSVGDILRGIRSGRIEKRIDYYYDNIKEIDPDYKVKDPWKMNRIQQLKHIQELQSYINQNIDSYEISNGESPIIEPETTE